MHYSPSRKQILTLRDQQVHKVSNFMVETRNLDLGCTALIGQYSAINRNTFMKGSRRLIKQLVNNRDSQHDSQAIFLSISKPSKCQYLKPDTHSSITFHSINSNPSKIHTKWVLNPRNHQIKKRKRQKKEVTLIFIVPPSAKMCLARK